MLSLSVVPLSVVLSLSLLSLSLNSLSLNSLQSHYTQSSLVLLAGFAAETLTLFWPVLLSVFIAMPGRSLQTKSQLALTSSAPIPIHASLKYLISRLHFHFPRPVHLRFDAGSDRELLENIRSDTQLLLSRRLDESTGALSNNAGAGGGPPARLSGDGIERVLFSGSSRHAPPRRGSVVGKAFLVVVKARMLGRMQGYSSPALTVLLATTLHAPILLDPLCITQLWSSHP